MRSFVFIVSAFSGYVESFIPYKLAKLAVQLVVLKVQLPTPALSMYPRSELAIFSSESFFICHMCLNSYVCCLVSQNNWLDEIRWLAYIEINKINTT